MVPQQETLYFHNKILWEKKMTQMSMFLTDLI